MERVDSPRDFATGMSRADNAAMTLAVRLEADLLLTDDRTVRRFATVEGIRPLGTLGVLLLALRLGLVDRDEVRRLVDDLVRSHRFSHRGRSVCGGDSRDRPGVAGRAQVDGLTFRDVTDTDQITDRNGMGSAVGDYDNDGDLDWFVSAIWSGDTRVEVDRNRRLKMHHDPVAGHARHSPGQGDPGAARACRRGAPHSQERRGQRGARPGRELRRACGRRSWQAQWTGLG